MIRPPKKISRGFTLIETLVLVTGLALIMSLVLVTLHALGQVSQNSRHQREAAATLLRLENHFRADAHAATATNPPLEFAVGPLDALRFLAPDGSVTHYQPMPNGLDRLHYAPGQTENPDLESFRIENTPRPTLTLTPLQGHTFATLLWPRPTRQKNADTKSAAPPWTIKAALARDYPPSPGDNSP